MFAAIAIAAALLFQPFHIVAIGIDAAGEAHRISPAGAFATRAECEAEMGEEVKAIEPRGNAVLTSDGPMEIAGMWCAAEALGA